MQLFMVVRLCSFWSRKLMEKKNIRKISRLLFSWPNQWEHRIHLLVLKNTLLRLDSTKSNSLCFSVFWSLASPFFLLYFSWSNEADLLGYSSSQEIISGSGHTSAVDWWALGMNMRESIQALFLFLLSSFQHLNYLQILNFANHVSSWLVSWRRFIWFQF